MSEIFVSHILSSEKIAVGSGVTLSSTHPTASTVRVYSDRNIHIAYVTATTSDLPLSAFTPFYISLAANEALAFTLATGEIPGSVWASLVNRS